MSDEPKKVEEKPKDAKTLLLEDKVAVAEAITQTRNLLAAISNELVKKEGALRYIEEKLKELEPKKEESKVEEKKAEGAVAAKPPLRIVK